jgi:Fic family protein
MAYQLHIPTPLFDDAVVDDILALEANRARIVVGSVHPFVFSSVKHVFHLLESLSSTRIEGNRTTVEDLAEAEATGNATDTEALREVHNIDDAMRWVEAEFETDAQRQIDAPFLNELHRLVVKNLRLRAEGGEGDERPGRMRSSQVYITNARFVPPTPTELPALVEELVEFINTSVPNRQELLRIAVAHHRFTHIHPYANGNGRVARLLTYAMLIRAGLRVHEWHILNPSAALCLDRAAYMHHLGAADSGNTSDMLAWCRFLLRGLRRDIDKAMQLLDASTVIDTLLTPVITSAESSGMIANHDARIMRALARETNQSATAPFFRQWFPDASQARLSQHIARLKRDGLIVAWPNTSSRLYVLNISGKRTIRALFGRLAELGFVSA